MKHRHFLYLGVWTGLLVAGASAQERGLFTPGDHLFGRRTDRAPQAGEPAPAIRVTALAAEGAPRRQVFAGQPLKGRPLVIAFGSYT